MPRKITEDCVACGACAEVCPEEAISEGDPIYVIDPDLCIDCGLCEDECPNGAIIEV
ncbi:MAG: 4Fe-4S binding protein [Anaerolineae bacterium]|nr:4Fe-4S binding protein [Anaerolineae bacterium]